MAEPTSEVYPLSGDPAVDGITNGTEWANVEGGTLSWSISDGFQSYYWKDPDATVEMLSNMFSTIESFINVNFEFVGAFTGEQTPEDAADAGSDLNFSVAGVGDVFSSSNTYALSHFPYEEFYQNDYDGIHGDTYLNIDSVANGWPYDPGSAGFSLMLHETGHALGLKHPHDGGGTGTPTFNDLDLGAFDSERFTVMSYNDGLNDVDAYNAASPMPFDVVGLQYMYGKNPSEHAADTTHRLVANQQYQTIWDAAGTDAVSTADAQQGWKIQLPDWLLSKEIGENWGVAEPLSSAQQEVPTTLYWLEGDIENVIGSAHGDELYGNALANRMVGNAGADWLEGDAGADTIRAGRGNDTLIGGADGDVLDGGAGRDMASYSASDGNVAVSLASGTGAGGAAEGDTLTAIEDLKGSAHGDRLTGDANANLLKGLKGDDTLLGYLGDDLLRGQQGDDLLFGYTGADVLIGGSGQDTAYYGGSGAGVNVSLAHNDANGGTATGDTLIGIENVTGSGHQDRLIGDAAANALSGQGGNDQLFGFYGNDLLQGQGGNDFLFGYAGADTLKGGSGQDTAYYGASGEGVYVSLAQGTGAEGTAAGDTLTRIENLIGSHHDDQLTGDAAANYLNGQAGNDQLFGFYGDDLLQGKAGNDFLFGYAGADMLKGGSGRDTAYYGASGEGVDVSLAQGTGAEGTAAGDTLTGIENLVGSGHDDRLTGDAGANYLNGQAGNDQLVGFYGDDLLQGKAGNDFLFGYAGADVLFGGSGEDTAYYGGSSAGVTVNLSAGNGEGGTAAGDTLFSVENVIGSGQGDTLTGDSGSNTLRGQAGADTLHATAGNDDLSGGADGDTFVFTPGVDWNAVIDWQGGQDTLDFTAFSFASVDQVQNNATVVDGDLEIALGGGDAVGLLGVTDPQALDQGNVLV